MIPNMGKIFNNSKIVENIFWNFQGIVPSGKNQEATSRDASILRMRSILHNTFRNIYQRLASRDVACWKYERSFYTWSI